MAHPALGLAERMGADLRAQALAQRGTARSVGGEPGRDLHILLGRTRAQIAEPGVAEVAVAQALEEGGADQRDRGHAHPQALAGGGAAGVRAAVERYVDAVVMRQMRAAHRLELE